MERLFLGTTFTRGLSVWLRYAVTTLLVIFAFTLRYALELPAPQYPFLLFFPVIILSAALFDHGSGIWATLLSALLAAYFFVPVGALRDPSQIVALAVFVGIGFATATLLEVMHGLLKKVLTAHEALLAAHARLQSVEGEKDLLIREMGHRTKNDLQMLASLLQLQRKATADPGARAALAAAADRAQVLGRVHDRLTRGDGAAVVDLKTFLGDLCDDLRTSLVGLRPVAVKVELESQVRPMEQAVAFGLILNELLTNALKYAFPDDRRGTIDVRLERREGELCLLVEDDGIGLPPPSEQAERSPGGMGQRLVRSLTQQLGGRFELDSRPGEGTRCAVHVAIAP